MTTATTATPAQPQQYEIVRAFLWNKTVRYQWVEWRGMVCPAIVRHKGKRTSRVILFPDYRNLPADATSITWVKDWQHDDVHAFDHFYGYTGIEHGGAYAITSEIPTSAILGDVMVSIVTA